MKPSGYLFYLSADDYPVIGNTTTSNIRLSPSNSVSGDIHILSGTREQVVKELRQLADALEKIDHNKLFKNV